MHNGLNPIDQVKKILDAGEIPVIKINRALDYEVEACSSRGGKTSYIAISHVWADGLGDDIGNELPVCQIQRLWRLCSDLLSSTKKDNSTIRKLFRRGQDSDVQVAPDDETMVLWIDTFCVPRVSRPHRILAITRMSETYADASKILLLDSEMMSIPSTCAEEEVLLRLLGSGWMRRVWTMQEGSLGCTKLYIQLANGIIDFYTVTRRLAKQYKKQKIKADVIGRDVALLYDHYEQSRNSFIATRSAYQWQQQKRSWPHALDSSLTVLKGCSTAHDGDAYLCLAGMIGMGSSIIQELISAAVPERTRVMLRHMNSISAAIIFSPGEKLTDPGYRWACASLWKTQPPPTRCPNSSITPEGLMVKMQGLTIKPIPLSPDYLLVDFKGSGAHYAYKVTYDPAAAAALLSLSQSTAPAPELGLIFSDEYFLKHGARGSETPAALVAITSRTTMYEKAKSILNRVINCQYLCQAVISLPQPSDYDGRAAGRARRPFGESSPSNPDDIHVQMGYTWAIT